MNSYEKYVSDVMFRIFTTSFHYKEIPHEDLIYTCTNQSISLKDFISSTAHKIKSYISNKTMRKDIILLKKWKKEMDDHRNFENGDKYSEKILEIGNHVYNIFPILQILTLYPYSQKGINFSYSDDFVEFITNEKIL